MNSTPSTGPDARVVHGLAFEGNDPGRIVGFDIGGTKCAVSRIRDGAVEESARMDTREFTSTFGALADAAQCVMPENPVIGISCGGPLDAVRGIILSPPNLHPSWHGVEITRLLTERFGGRAMLMNDANACALAEWRLSRR